MGKGISSLRSNPILLLLLPTLAFGAGFGLAIQMGQEHTREVGGMAGSHLDYALELKDDIAVIDWAKDMQKADKVLAFRAVAGSKVVAEGGNRNLLAGTFPMGTSYLFPDQFLYHETSDRNLQNPRELFLCYRASPGPLFWALFGGLASLLTGLWGWRGQSQGPRTTPSPAASPPSIPALKPAKLPSIFLRSKQDEPYLLLDKNFVILQASPEAAQLLGKGSTDLSQSHLLDLAPDPILMQAIEKAEEAHLPLPFPATPAVSLTVKPGPEGTFLLLRIPDRPKPPQNQ